MLTNEKDVCVEIDNMGFEASLPTKRSPRADLLDLDLNSPSLTSSVSIAVEGMTCQSCVRTIEGGLRSRTGVKQALVDLQSKLAHIQFDASITNAETLRQAIDDMGFDATLLTPRRAKQALRIDETVIVVRGMTCMSCVKNIEQVVSEKPGVVSVSVSLQEEKARIRYDASVTDAHALCEHIDDMGFEASVPDSAFDDIARRNRTNNNPNLGSCVVAIEGMTCKSCVANIEGVIGELPEVNTIRVSLERKRGDIEFDASVTSAQALADRIDDMGFECHVIEATTPPGGGGGNDATPRNSGVWSLGTVEQVSLSITGLRESDVERVRNLLSNSPAVVAVKVSPHKSVVEVLYNPLHTSSQNLCKLVERAGIRASPQGDSADPINAQQYLKILCNTNKFHISNWHQSCLSKGQR